MGTYHQHSDSQRSLTDRCKDTAADVLYGLSGGLASLGREMGGGVQEPFLVDVSRDMNVFFKNYLGLEDPFYRELRRSTEHKFR